MFGLSNTLNLLLAQLGLPDDEPGMSAFLEQHRPLSPEVTLARAPWWSPAQSAFLLEAIEDDSEWAVAAGELDALLR